MKHTITEPCLNITLTEHEAEWLNAILGDWMSHTDDVLHNVNYNAPIPNLVTQIIRACDNFLVGTDLTETS